MKKIFILMLCMIFLVGTVSALEFDNAGRYDEATKTITIKNGCDPFGLVCLGKDIAEAKLLTPLDNKVPVGKNILVAEIEVTGFINYDDFFSGLEMFDIKKNMAKDNRVYDIKIRYNENYQVNDYGMTCSLDPQSTNGTNICRRVQTGSHTEVREIWKELAPQDLKQNSVLNVGIFTEVKNADSVEWIPELFGVKIDEWAAFSATGGTVTFRDIGGLNFSVHTFTTNGTFTVTGSGNLTEVLIIAGGAAGGGNTGNVGAGGGAGGLVFAENLSISAGSFPIIVGVGGIAAVSNTRGGDGQNSSAFGLVGIGGGGGGAGAGSGEQDGNDGGSAGGGAFTGGLGGTGIQGNFSNATGFGRDGGDAGGSSGTGAGGGANNTGDDGAAQIGGNSSNARAFDINGTSFNYSCGGAGGGTNAGFSGTSFCGGGNGGGDDTGEDPTGENATTFGSGGGGSAFNGTSGTFAGGFGRQGVVIILFLPTEGPDVTLNSPIDNFNSTNNTIDFNGTVISNSINTIANVSLFIDGIINETNTSGINNTDYLFTKILSDGTHNWTYEAFDNESTFVTATTRTFTINTTAFINYTDPTPINEFNTTNDFFEVNVTITEDFFQNLTFDLYNRLGTLNRTITFTNSTRIQNWSSLIDGNYSYNVTVATTTNQFNSTVTRNISVDSNPPIIIVTSPTGDQGTFTSGLNLTLAWTASDANIDTCQYDYQGFNTTVACGSSPINLTVNDSTQTSLIFYVNDTFGQTSFNSTSWTYSFIENNITFTPNVFETDSQFFQINLSTSLNVSAISAELNYNGTNFISSAACGDFCLVNNTIDIPLVSSGEFENKSFFWEISIFNGTDSINVNTSSTEQNVTRIHLEECDVTFTVEALNFTVYDEQNLSRIDPFLFDGDFDQWLGTGDVKRQSNFTNSSISEKILCISPEDESFFIDSTIEYDEAGNASLYTLRNYYFQNDTINNVSQDILMYLLQSSFSTSFILKVQDDALLPVANVLIETNRFYPGLNQFRIVQIAKTDDLGKSVGFFETEIVDYKFIITLNNDTLLETGIQKVIPESSPFTLTFNLGQNLGEPWISQIPIVNLISTLIWNDITGIITYTYTDNSTNLTLARLFVIQQSLVNSSADSTICNENSSLTSAILTCDVGNDSGFYTASSFITRDSTEVLDLQITFQIETLSAIVGLLGLFYGWFLILIASFMFRFNEIAGIWSITIVVLLVNLIGLINFGGVFVTAIIGIAIFLTWIMSN